MDKNDSLLEEIESLRNNLHRLIGKENVENHEILIDSNVLKTSKNLDKLILQYMKKK